jgi:tRNA(adenine34) deaminase
MYPEAKDSLEIVERKLGSIRPDPGYAHDAYVMAAIDEAIQAVKEGNFGIGAVIVNPKGEIVQRGHNRVFAPYFRSDLHAEMDALTCFEERFRDLASMADYTLVSSLEPCPMCLTRLITSRIGKVFYAAEDRDSGMVTRLQSLSPVWVKLAAQQVFDQAQCAPVLRELAQEVVLYLNRWIQPDTIIPDPYNPQDWDRYAYVRNNPVINADPTGHMLDQGGGAASMGDDWWKKRQDKTHSLPKPPLDTKKQWTKNVGDFATLLDSFAALSNGAYAVTGDLVTLACPGCYPLVLAGYRYYSYIPNSISTVSMGLWVGQGFITGENSFSIAQSSSETTVSLSISQDSIAAINTNTIGWLIPEPNVAFALDSAVVGYDYGRSGLGDLIRPQTIPTWINPTFSYNTSNGFNFSWRK